MKKPIPKFASEDAEREFWATHDSTDYIDWRKGERVIPPNLKPSTQTISLRLPKPMLDRLKLLANKRDVPYQSLLKMFVAERLKAELESTEGDTVSRSEQTSPRAAFKIRNRDSSRGSHARE